jgi:hypothetical protein
MENYSIANQLRKQLPLPFDPSTVTDVPIIDEDGNVTGHMMVGGSSAQVLKNNQLTFDILALRNQKYNEGYCEQEIVDAIENLKVKFKPDYKRRSITIPTPQERELDWRNKMNRLKQKHESLQAAASILLNKSKSLNIFYYVFLTTTILLATLLIISKFKISLPI